MYHVAAAAAYQAANNITNSAMRIDQGARGDIQTLEAKLERQHLLIQTLLMILLEKKVIHEDEFKEWLVYVDELDGARDGKLREDKSPIVCESCGRNNTYTATKCQYCGHGFSPEFLAHKPKG